MAVLAKTQNAWKNIVIALKMVANAIRNVNAQTAKMLRKNKWDNLERGLNYNDLQFFLNKSYEY